MAQELRSYQNDAVAAVFDAWIEGHTSILYTQATGTGKTTVAAEIVRRFVQDYKYKVLATVHRREIVRQIYCRFRDHLNLDEGWDIGIEMADDRARLSNLVVVSNIATVRNPKRLHPNWIPDVIFIDESHRSSSSSYQLLRKQYPNALVIGCTATPKRTDKACLYAVTAIKPTPDIPFVEDEFGYRLLVSDGKETRPVRDDEAVFQKHCYDYSMLDAINDGWLVPIRGMEVATQVDISKVGTAGGDFVQSQLLKVIEDDESVMMSRIDLMYEKWKEVAPERPTVVFCVGVKTAKWAADYWRSKGFTAADVNGETPPLERDAIIKDFLTGRTQVLTNCDVVSEGTDLPPISCICHLAPTKSWVRYVQRCGRGTRSLVADEIGKLDTPEERIALIAASAKPDCLILDGVDICKNGSLCTVPAIIDLPFSIDLEGESVTKAKKLIDEYEEVKEQALGEMPKTFRKLAGRLQEIQLLTQSGAKHRAKWNVREDGNYQFGQSPPGYSAMLNKEGDQWRMVVRHRDTVLKSRVGKPDRSPKEFFDAAAEQCAAIIKDHKKNTPKPSQGTLAWLDTWKNNTGRWAYRDLKAAGFEDHQIDAMPKRQLWATLENVRQRKKERVA